MFGGGWGRLAARGEGSGGGDGGVALGLSPFFLSLEFGFISLFSILRITYTLVFFSRTLQVSLSHKNARSSAAGGRARLRIM
jgi:hypothetical protein